MAKPKISSDWMAGCAGCHMSLLDIDERIVQVAELADIRSTPITDLKEPDESGVDVGILEGGVNNSANEEVALKMRKRSKILVALGDCAVFGGVPALRNFCGIQEALKRAYIEKYGEPIPVTDCDIFYTIMESTLDDCGVPTHADGSPSEESDMWPVWLDALRDMIESHNEMKAV